MKAARSMSPAMRTQRKSPSARPASAMDRPGPSRPRSSAAEPRRRADTMTLSIENYRALDGGRLVIRQDSEGRESISNEDISFGQRITAWRNGDSFSHGTEQQIAENKTFKQSFYTALCNAESVD